MQHIHEITPIEAPAPIPNPPPTNVVVPEQELSPEIAAVLALAIELKQAAES